MEENEIIKLLTDENKAITNWDALLIYFALRYNNNDLNGLYNLVLLAKEKAEKISDFSSLDLVYFDFFLASILEREFVGWRANKHLVAANEKLEKIDFKNLLNEEKIEVAKFYYDLGKHYETIELIKPAIEAYHNSSNIYFELSKLEDAQYIDSKIIECNYHLVPDNRHLISAQEITKKYGKKSYLFRVLETAKKEKYNLIEQSDEYLKAINKINEELVRKGIYANDSRYKEEKQKLLKAQGIDWKY